MLDDPHPVTQQHIPEEWNPKYDSLLFHVIHGAAQCEGGNISCVPNVWVFVCIVLMTVS